jgi:hypothetical protein
MTALNACTAPLQALLDRDSGSEGVDSATRSIARGRELARLGLEEAVAEIRRRASAGLLNRGLSLSLPYFDGRALELRHREISVVPRGRVLFVPAFVVLACGREVDAVRRDPALDETTRQHLVEALQWLADAFRP